jgi:hypothetical protein
LQWRFRAVSPETQLDRRNILGQSGDPGHADSLPARELCGIGNGFAAYVGLLNRRHTDSAGRASRSPNTRQANRKMR